MVDRCVESRGQRNGLLGTIGTFRATTLPCFLGEPSPPTRTEQQGALRQPCDRLSVPVGSLKIPIARHQKNIDRFRPAAVQPKSSLGLLKEAALLPVYRARGTDISPSIVGRNGGEARSPVPAQESETLRPVLEGTLSLPPG
jgi:hypothetical protein